MPDSLEVRSLWRTKVQMCAELGVSGRTLQRRVRGGQLERRYNPGQAALYRAVNVSGQADTSGQRPDRGGQLEVSGHPLSGVDTSGQAPPEPATTPIEVSGQCPAGQVATLDSHLIEINDRLVARVAELEADNAVATHLQRQAETDRNRLVAELADVDEHLVRAVDALVNSNRDVRRLQDALQRTLDAVSATADSPMSIPVRRRLRAILATCPPRARSRLFADRTNPRPTRLYSLKTGV